MLQLGYLFAMNHRRRNVRTAKERYVPLMLMLLLFSFVADMISSLSHVPSWIFPFAAAGNYVEIILNTMLLPIYFLYVCQQISRLDRSLKRRITMVLCLLAGICSVIVLSTAFNKLTFYFDAENHYHRGPLFWLPMSILFLMMLMIEGFIINQKANIEIKHFKALLLFLVFPLIGWGFQLFVLGLPFSLISATFAAQIVFTNIQNRSMDTDYLTGVFNRQSLDNHVQRKIDAATSNHSFSAILLDIDNFKSINDCFGHYEGDVALIHTASLLRSSVRSKDFIARYGGDEFCIVFDEDTPSALDVVMQRINSNLLEFSKMTKKPYQLNFSMGFAVYDPAMGRRTEHFIKVIDLNMYTEKRSHKAAGEKS
jgi:diguanylate cyclase (GGDEF)-like protein